LKYLQEVERQMLQINKFVFFQQRNVKQRFFQNWHRQFDVPVICWMNPAPTLMFQDLDLYYKWIETYCKTGLVIISSNDKNEYKLVNW